MKSTKTLYHALMIKYVSKTMDAMNQLSGIRANYMKNSHLNNYSEKPFCQAIKYCFNSENSFLNKL